MIQALTDLATDKHIRNIARKITNHRELYEDLIHEVFIIIYDMGDEYVSGLISRGEIRRFFIAIMHYQWNNPYNQFNKKYDHLSQYETLSPFTPYPESTESPIWVTSGDVVNCSEYFDTVTPERVTLSRHLKRMEAEDKAKKNNHGFPYRTRLLEMFKKYPSLRKLESATNINYGTLKRDLDNIYKEIRESL